MWGDPPINRLSSRMAGGTTAATGADAIVRIAPSSKIQDGWLDVEAANTGVLVTPDPSRTPSTGIRTLSTRLELLLGPDASVATRVEQG